MGISTRKKTMAKENEYRVVSGGKVKVITAKNIQEAYAKAGRLFPKAKQVTVSRKTSRKGQEYETYVISR